MPSNALATIAALTPKNIDISVVDDYLEDIDFDKDVDLVGIAGMTYQTPRAYQIADEFRKRGKRVVMGGIHVTTLPEEAKQNAGDQDSVQNRLNMCMRKLLIIKTRCFKLFLL